MRKRIALALLIVSVIGVALFFLSQPKKGSAEWHKREYLRATKGDLRTRAQSMWLRIRGKADPFVLLSSEMPRLAEHQRALIELGFLEKQELVFSNRTAEGVLFAGSFESMRSNLLADPRLKQLQWEFVEMTPSTQETSIILVAPRHAFAALEEFFRKADVPERGE